MSPTEVCPDGTRREVSAKSAKARFSTVPTKPPPSVPVVPTFFEVSKLKLRRELRAVGLESDYDAFIDSLPAPARKDFDDSQVLRTDDELFAPAFADFARAKGKTEAELKTLLWRAKA